MLSVCLCQRIMFSEIWSVMDYVRCRVLQCTLRLIAASGIGACRSNPPRSIRDWAQQEGLLILGKTQKKNVCFPISCSEANMNLSQSQNVETKYYVWFGVPGLRHLHWRPHDLATPRNNVSNWILIREQPVISFAFQCPQQTTTVAFMQTKHSNTC